jgi:uncharacterized protein
MDIVLSPVEARVLGSLVEKELTTPEYYPLSLNALTAACNQKNNRDPAMSLSADDVTMALESLRGKNLAWQLSTAGGRVPKFEHNLPARLAIAAQGAPADAAGAQGNVDTSAENAPATRSIAANMVRPELAILTELLLRGPLTAGELRTVTARMHAFPSIDEVEAYVLKLMSPALGPLIAKLPKQPGKKEQRYAHCFFGDVPAQQVATTPPEGASPAPVVAGSVNDRFAVLEQKVNMLADEIVAIKQAIVEMKKLVE